MTRSYFYTKFKDQEFTNPLDLCSDEEKGYLICLSGCFISAVARGELDFKSLGNTPKERVLNFLKED